MKKLKPPVMIMSSATGFAGFMVVVGSVVQFAYNDPTFSVVMAGGAGGLVRWATEREPWREGLTSVVVGAICAQYLGPVAIGMVESVMGIEVPDTTGKTGAFLMGIGGISIVALLTSRLKKFRSKSDES